MSLPTDRDLSIMRRAILLSRKGFPAPNPHVGCVIVDGDEIVGEGYHRYAGAAHAEVAALAAAGSRAKGATAYVTLEPCNHHGRTPPCTRALIEAGIAKVLVACLDPNPKAAGGFEKLRSNGIEVIGGVLEDDAAEANEQFLSAMRLKRPRITLKAAVSLDGRIALPNGDSKWLTGPDARTQAHRLRAERGAVLVGRRTIEADDPSLTARIPGVVNQPVRVILDPQGKLDSRWKVFDESAPTLHLVNGKFGLKAGDNGFDLQEVSEALFREGINGLLVEGGSSTLSSFIRAHLFDEIELFVAPKLLGDGPSWVEALGVGRVADARELRVTSVKKFKADLQVSLRPELGN